MFRHVLSQSKGGSRAAANRVIAPQNLNTGEHQSAGQQWGAPLLPAAQFYRPTIQMNDDEVGLVPPTTHGRDGKFKSPDNPQGSKGHKHALGSKDLTRSERMINRIGRVLVQQENVHVAVALDGNALVLSANKEEATEERALTQVAARLRNILENGDPLGVTPNVWKHPNVPQEKRTKDQRKIKTLLEGKYTEDEGIEMNEEVAQELKAIKTAIEAGIIGQEAYSRGEPGIYVIATPRNPGERAQNMHGELKVTSAIKERRAGLEGPQKDVFVGGTWLDCFACNASHKITNETLSEKKATWKFYTGGTHGGMFVGYRPKAETVDKHERFQALTGESMDEKDGDIPKVNTQIPPEDGQLAYESDSEDEDYEVLRLDRKLERARIKGQEKTLQEDLRRLEAPTKLEENLRTSHRELSTIEQRLKNALKQKVEEETRFNAAKEQISRIEKDIERLQGASHGGGTENALEKDKKGLEEKLKQKFNQERKVKWNGKKWIEDGWDAKGRSQQILENASKSTNSGLELSQKHASSEIESNRQSLEQSRASLLRWQQSLEEIGKALPKIQETIEELQKQEKAASEMYRKLKEARAFEKSGQEKEFQEKHSLTPKDVSYSITLRRSRREKMDNFQFEYDL